MTTTTATTSQIRALLTAAGQAGDMQQVSLCEAAADHGDELADYARRTAADTGDDTRAAVRAMRAELGEVARDVGCPVAVVSAWIACWEALSDAEAAS